MIRSENDGVVSVVTLMHGKVNALDIEFLTEIIDQFDRLQKSDTKAVVLTGEGSSFSAGVDLFRLVDGGVKYITEFWPLLLECFLKVFTFPKPVVAAVNGHAIAGGCVLACACDYRVMSKGPGVIGVPELLVGVPFPSLPLEIVRFAVPKRHLQKLVYTGKTCVAEEALDFGLIDAIEEPEKLLDSALAMAQRLAKIPADAFRITKQLLRQPALDRHQKLKGTLDPEAFKVWISKETNNVIRKYLEKTIGKKKQ